MTHEPPVPPPPPPPASGMPPPPPPPQSSSQDQVAQAAADIGAKAGAAYHDARRRFLGLEEPERFTVGGAIIGLVGVIFLRWAVAGTTTLGYAYTQSVIDFTGGWLFLVGIVGAGCAAVRPAIVRDLLARIGQGVWGVNRTGFGLAILAVVGVIVARVSWGRSAPVPAGAVAERVMKDAYNLMKDMYSMGLGWYVALGGSAAAVWGTFRRWKISGP